MKRTNCKRKKQDVREAESLRQKEDTRKAEIRGKKKSKEMMM